MRRIKVVTVLSSLSGLVLLAGCVESHRAHPVVYAPPAVVVPTPTSTSSAVRVYPDTAPGVTAPAGVSAADLNLAESVRQVLKGSPGLATITQNMDATVDNGVVTLRGTVPTEADRRLMEDRVRQIPGVDRVDNDLKVELR